MAAEDTIAFGTSISACNSVGYWPLAWRLLEMMHFSALEVTFAAKTHSLKDLDSPKMTVFLNCPPCWRLGSQSRNLSWLLSFLRLQGQKRLFPFLLWGSSNLPTKGNMKMPAKKNTSTIFCFFVAPDSYFQATLLFCSPNELLFDLRFQHCASMRPSRTWTSGAQQGSCSWRCRSVSCRRNGGAS